MEMIRSFVRSFDIHYANSIDFKPFLHNIIVCAAGAVAEAHMLIEEWIEQR